MKKKVIFLLIMTILFNTFCISGVASENSEEEVFMVEKKDFSTGEISTVEIPVVDEADEAEAFIPDGESIIEGRNIIGTDERSRVATELSNSMMPFRGVGLLEVTWNNGAVSWGTGWLFGPNDIATAGHMVYNSERGGYASRIVFYPALNGPKGPANGYIATNVSASVDYLLGDEQNDYAVFEVGSNIGNNFGYFGWATSISPGARIQSIGYPGDKPQFEMWHCYGVCQRLLQHSFLHTLDTVKSQSGSPVYTPTDTKVRGIHIGFNNELINNEATLIQGELANLLYNRRNH